MLSVIADQAIPLLRTLLPSSVKLTLLANDNINNAALRTADALIVRSVTKVNAQLLASTPLKFVGTATSGTDHLDKSALQANGIAWFDSAGANSQAVLEYVVCCVAWLQENGHLPKSNFSVGVVGAGKIGTKVIDFFKTIGATVRVSDPPRAKIENDFHSVALKELKDCDLITCHVPLTDHGEDKTFHLLDENFLSRQKKGFLINTSRGEVIDSNALKKSLQITPIFDVWENEPDIDEELLQRALIATPHIAGYTDEAKAVASQIICKKLLRFFNLANKNTKPNNPTHPISIQSPSNWQQVVLSIYNPFNDTEKLKRGKNFKDFRDNYRLRKAFNYPQLRGIEKLPKRDQIILN